MVTGPRFLAGLLDRAETPERFRHEKEAGRAENPGIEIYFIAIFFIPFFLLTPANPHKQMTFSAFPAFTSRASQAS